MQSRRIRDVLPLVSIYIVVFKFTLFFLAERLLKFIIYYIFLKYLLYVFKFYDPLQHLDY